MTRSLRLRRCRCVALESVSDGIMSGHSRIRIGPPGRVMSPDTELRSRHLCPHPAPCGQAARATLVTEPRSSQQSQTKTGWQRRGGPLTGMVGLKLCCVITLKMVTLVCCLANLNFKRFVIIQKLHFLFKIYCSVVVVADWGF